MSHCNFSVSGDPRIGSGKTGVKQGSRAILVTSWDLTLFREGYHPRNLSRKEEESKTKDNMAKITWTEMNIYKVHVLRETDNITEWRRTIHGAVKPRVEDDWRQDRTYAGVVYRFLLLDPTFYRCNVISTGKPFNNPRIEICDDRLQLYEASQLPAESNNNNNNKL